jgi:hypothetical protein
MASITDLLLRRASDGAATLFGGRPAISFSDCAVAIVYDQGSERVLESNACRELIQMERRINSGSTTVADQTQ